MIISMLCDLDCAPAKTFMLAFPSSQFLSLCLSVTAITGYISSPSSQLGAHKKLRKYLQLFSVSSEPSCGIAKKSFLSAYEYTVWQNDIGVLGSYDYSDGMGLWYISDQYQRKLWKLRKLGLRPWISWVEGPQHQGGVLQVSCTAQKRVSCYI